jgi:hypothetical protein
MSLETAKKSESAVRVPHQPREPKPGDIQSPDGEALAGLFVHLKYDTSSTELLRRFGDAIRTVFGSIENALVMGSLIRAEVYRRVGTSPLDISVTDNPQSEPHLDDQPHVVLPERRDHGGGAPVRPHLDPDRQSKLPLA